MLSCAGNDWSHSCNNKKLLPATQSTVLPEEMFILIPHLLAPVSLVRVECTQDRHGYVGPAPTLARAEEDHFQERGGEWHEDAAPDNKE